MSALQPPPAEITIDTVLVHELLREQHPDLAHLPLANRCEGWDNVMFRLGPDLAVRLPRRAAAASLIDHEQRWLPDLASRLPLPVPVPLRFGVPGSGYPWRWSVVCWLPGHSALNAGPCDMYVIAHQLGQFVHLLHEPAPADAPHNPVRGIPLDERSARLLEHLDAVDERIDRGAALRVWDRAVAAAPWTGPPLWIHGDLHPGNLLIEKGKLAGVLDFGDLTAGDPATDLAVMWVWLPAAVRDAFVHSARSLFNSIDQDTLARARGWALSMGLAVLAHRDSLLQDVAMKTVDAVIAAD